ncbi:MAG TPA: 16S rRNA (cytosine(1402)-N(4))-methyltransferase RsmH [Chroococcales cyanobacterium]
MISSPNEESKERKPNEISEAGPANQLQQAGFSHVTVLLEEAVDLLNVRPGLTYVDATAGAGGHLQEIWNRTKSNIESGGAFLSADQNQPPQLIAIDRDNRSLSKLRDRFGSSISYANANFEEIETVVKELGHRTITGGILADLGVSSMQIDDPDRGFSFMRDGPLDMRMDTDQSLTAEYLINNSSESQLAEIIFKYGEERYSRRIASAIVRARPLHTTLELAEVVSRCVKRSSSKHGSGRDSLHPATRTFQAVRIAVNNELENLEKFLHSAISVLSPGARLVVITFHSLEDRLVKQIFRESATNCICPPRQPLCTCQHKAELLIITRKPVVAGEKEVLANIRSRSAKLRAGEKIS